MISKKYKIRKTNKIKKTNKKINNNNILQSKIRNILKETLIKQLKPWKNINKSKINEELEDYFKLNKKEKCLMKLVIKKKYVKQPNLSYLDNLYKLRGNIIYNMFKFFISKIKYNIGNITLFITLKDYVISDNLPILSFAKCHNQNGILIPDWTFHLPYKSKIKTFWNNQINEISNVCDKIKYKKELVFFQGADTSSSDKEIHYKQKTFIRRNLKNISMKNKEVSLEILIDNEPKSSVTDWCTYKYLLDLPGAHPWSVRFKELLLTKSLILKVDVKDRWVNFYSDIFKPGEDYIQLIFENADTLEAKIKNTEKTYSDLVKAIKNITESKYKKITTSANNKIKMLDNKMLIYFFENLIREYKKVFY